MGTVRKAEFSVNVSATSMHYYGILLQRKLQTENESEILRLYTDQIWTRNYIFFPKIPFLNNSLYNILIHRRQDLTCHFISILPIELPY